MSESQKLRSMIVDISKHLQARRETILRWIKNGMPARKLGNRWRFKLSKVDKWINSGKAETKASKGDKNNG